MRRLRPPTEDALRAALATAVHRSAELRFIHRLHAVLLVTMGCSCYEVAHWFGEDPRSVERWIHAYELQGPDGLREHPRIGRSGVLTAQQMAQLAQETAGEPAGCGYSHSRWSGKLLALHLEHHYGVRLSQRHCQRLLQRLRN